ncbi:hypothetical protein CTAM01_17303 [Colletotrichum tamarilloi]|uniref:Uncharacterized protein n=1 Tax=Colletotrichum tamarilloi TaxID=1209934 RepID=A0ABQ9QG29_9PEZI|nr:uncharacterized protein CTAM01_17303 [Colletotrichum tamarilloi]KAK1451106.1 hypothetical protein CTAM01_17303 [Colletotrichum tamarilloi]
MAAPELRNLRVCRIYAGMIEIGHNLYYCFTCANVTGHPKAPGAAKLPKHTK